MELKLVLFIYAFLNMLSFKQFYSCRTNDSMQEVAKENKSDYALLDIILYTTQTDFLQFLNFNLAKPVFNLFQRPIIPK